MFEGINEVDKKKVIKTFTVLLAVIALFFAFKVIEQVRSLKYLGGVPTYYSITVSGDGEVFAVADTATVNYSYTAEGATVKEAQDMLNEKMNAAIAKVTEVGVEAEKVKTISYSSTPKYKYDGYTMWPRYEQEIIGYKVDQTNEVKISNTELVEPVLAALAEIGNFQVYGPTFEVGDTDALEEEARSLAIQDARDEAEKLAKDLGVKIVRVMSFYDESGSYYPMSDKAYGAESAMNMDVDQAMMAPALEPGQDKITKSVSVTFEIR